MAGEYKRIYIGAGSSCNRGLQVHCLVTNVILDGTFSTSVRAIESYYLISNIRTETTVILQIQGACSNIFAEAGLTIEALDDGCISNVFAESAGSVMSLIGDNIMLSNSLINGTLTSASGFNQNLISNCNITGAVTITGNDCTMTGCKVGADAGGGAVTITIAEAANRTNVIGCRGDAIISDSGTDTAIVAWQTY